MATWREYEYYSQQMSEWLGIPWHQVLDAKSEVGWTWKQVADQFERQGVAAVHWQDDGEEIYFDEDLPDIFRYYHPA